MSFTSVFNDCTGLLAIGGDATFDEVMEMLDKRKRPEFPSGEVSGGG